MHLLSYVALRESETLLRRFSSRTSLVFSIEDCLSRCDEENTNKTDINQVYSDLPLFFAGYNCGSCRYLLSFRRVARALL